MSKPTNKTFLELMESCVYSALKGMESDFEYQNSEEFAKDELINGGFEFTQDGNIF